VPKPNRSLHHRAAELGSCPVGRSYGPEINRRRIAEHHRKLARVERTTAIGAVSRWGWRNAGHCRAPDLADARRLQLRVPSTSDPGRHRLGLVALVGGVEEDGQLCPRQRQRESCAMSDQPKRPTTAPTEHQARVRSPPTAHPRCASGSTRRRPAARSAGRSPVRARGQRADRKFDAAVRATATGGKRQHAELTAAGDRAADEELPEKCAWTHHTTEQLLLCTSPRSRLPTGIGVRRCRSRGGRPQNGGGRAG